MKQKRVYSDNPRLFNGTKRKTCLTLEDLLARGVWVGECLEFTGALTDTGYGQLQFNRKHQKAHRVVYKLHYGVELTATQFVCHTCDNRKCINPEHLWVGNNTDNILDMVRKGRGSNQFGEYGVRHER